MYFLKPLPTKKTIISKKRKQTEVKSQILKINKFN
jgi:hypothetical protein